MQLQMGVYLLSTVYIPGYGLHNFPAWDSEKQKDRCYYKNKKSNVSKNNTMYILTTLLYFVHASAKWLRKQNRYS